LEKRFLDLAPAAVDGGAQVTERDPDVGGRGQAAKLSTCSHG
jgi:hypothetical protein